MELVRADGKRGGRAQCEWFPQTVNKTLARKSQEIGKKLVKSPICIGGLLI